MGNAPEQPTVWKGRSDQAEIRGVWDNESDGGALRDFSWIFGREDIEHGLDVRNRIRSGPR